MIYLIFYILLVFVVFCFHKFFQKKIVDKKLSGIYYGMDKIGFEYSLLLYRNWHKIYKNDAETSNLLFSGRKRFFNEKKHDLEKLSTLYKSYDLDYLSKLLNQEVSVDGYEDLGKNLKRMSGNLSFLSGVKKILVVMSVGILYFFVSDKKYS